MIGAYRKLWPNRAGTGLIDSQEELERRIRIELDDELTHPRVRKSKAEKLAFALERIRESDLSEEEKAGLSGLYEEIASR